MGKSTIARQYVQDHPLALNLDIDLVRRQLGRWTSNPEESGLRARAIALAAAGVHLRAGYDVVVPQYLGRATFIEQLEQVAAETGVPFCEVVLMTTRDEAVRRFEQRTRAATEPTHVEAWQMIGTETETETETDVGVGVGVGAMYDRLLTLLEQRPAAVVVDTAPNDPEATYRRLLDALGTWNSRSSNRSRARGRFG